MSNAVDEVMEERNKQYSDAWALTGEVSTNKDVHKGLEKLLMEFPQAWFPWVMIFNKLFRAFGSPRNPDHWLDIAGYATLVYNKLAGKDDNNE